MLRHPQVGRAPGGHLVPLGPPCPTQPASPAHFLTTGPHLAPALELPQWASWCPGISGCSASGSLQIERWGGSRFPPSFACLHSWGRLRTSIFEGDSLGQPAHLKAGSPPHGHWSWHGAGHTCARAPRGSHLPPPSGLGLRSLAWPSRDPPPASSCCCWILGCRKWVAPPPPSQADSRPGNFFPHSWTGGGKRYLPALRTHFDHFWCCEEKGQNEAPPQPPPAPPLRRSMPPWQNQEASEPAENLATCSAAAGGVHAWGRGSSRTEGIPTSHLDFSFLPLPSRLGRVCPSPSSAPLARGPPSFPLALGASALPHTSREPGVYKNIY